METKVEIKVPDDSQEGTEMALANWLKKPGEYVHQHEPIAEINTDKAVIEVPAPVSGTFGSTLVRLDEKVTPGQVLGFILPGEQSAQKVDSSVSQPEAPRPMQTIRQGEHHANESVTRLATLHSIDLSTIQGSGRDGRITYQDLLPFLPGSEKKSTISSRSSLPEIQVPSHRVPHDFMRRKIAERMSDSLLHTAPHVTSVFDCDMTNVIQHRSQNKAALEKAGVKLTFTAYFVQATVHAIQKVPEVNSRFYPTELEIYDDINIGIGTALEDKGLVVPVIHQAQNLSLNEIAEKLSVLTVKAREGKLSAEEMSRGTFTISNHGVSGSLFAAPIIIQQPQSAILGIGKLEERVVAIDGVATVRPKIYVTLSIDHRVLDAHHTNTFLSHFVEFLEKY